MNKSEVMLLGFLGIMSLVFYGAELNTMGNVCGALIGMVYLRSLLFSVIDEIAIKTADEIERRQNKYNDGVSDDRE